MNKPIVITVTGSPPNKTQDTWGTFSQWIIDTHPANQFLIVDCDKGDPLPPLTTIAGVIITGSPAMVTEREPWSVQLEQWVIAIANTPIPLLGICYGHQLIAQALGGHVGFHPKGREIGTVPIHLTHLALKDTLFSESPPRFVANVTHAQSVLTLPPTATLLASNDYEPHHAFSVGTNIWGVQFHPEFSADVMRFYLFERYDSLLEQGLDIQQLFQQVEETPASRALLNRFISLCVADHSKDESPLR